MSTSSLIIAHPVGGDKNYIIDDEKNALNVKEQCIMGPDEYDDMINSESYVMFMYTKALPRKGKSLQNYPNLEMVKQGVAKYQEFTLTQANIAKMMTEDFGMPSKQAYSHSLAGVESLFNYYRGIKGLSIDLRRNYEKVCEAADWITEQTKTNFYASPAAQCKGQTPGYAYDMFYSILCHTILNAKSFERLIWPKFKELSEYATEYDKTCYIHNEGNSEHLYDFWKELPADRFTFALEQNDIFRFKKECPNCVPQGGMYQTVLSKGTTQQVVDHAKMLIDKLGFDGKFILATDKMMSFANDCKPENLDALCKFMVEFRY